MGVHTKTFAHGKTLCGDIMIHLDVLESFGRAIHIGWFGQLVGNGCVWSRPLQLLLQAETGTSPVRRWFDHGDRQVL